MRTPVIGVMGGHAPDLVVEAQAESLGRAIANEGWILLTGGRSEGVMEAATRGAHEAGGFTVGLHPGFGNGDDVAAGLSLAIFTGIGFARNMCNVLSSDVVVALPGSNGTLNEVSFAQTYHRPTILYGFRDNNLFRHVVRVEDEDACIAAIRAALEKSQA